jgi:hypothetical protein
VSGWRVRHDVVLLVFAILVALAGAVFVGLTVKP